MFGLAGGMGNLGMGVAFSLVDDFSGTADKIASKFKELDGITEAATQKISSSMNRMKQGFLLAGAGLAITVPLLGAVNTAAQYSDALSDVKKTTGLAGTQLELFTKQVEALDTRTGALARMDIARVGGALGVPTEQLLGFTEQVDKAVVALGDEFKGGVEEVSNSLGILKGLFSETRDMQFGDAMNRIGSAMNALGAEGAAQGPSMAQFMNRIGQLGDLAPSVQQSLALAATFDNMGMSANVAAGGVSNILLLAGEHTKEFAAQLNMTQDQFKNLLDTSPYEVITKLAGSLEGASNTQIISTLQRLKIGSQESIKAIAGLSGNMEMLSKMQKISSEEFEKGTSLTEEFNEKNTNLAATIEKMKNSFFLFAKNLGMAAAPLFTPLYVGLKVVIDLASAFLQTGIGKALVFVTGLVGLLATGVGIYVVAVNFATYASAQAAVAFNSMGMSAVASAFMTGGLTTGLWAVASAAWAAMAPLLPFIAAGAAFVGIFLLVRKALNDFDDSMNSSLKPNLEGFSGFILRIGGAIRGVIEIFKNWNGTTFELTEGMHDRLEQMGILQFVLNVGTWVVRLKEFFSGFMSGLGDVWTVLQAVGSAIKTAFNALFDVINSLGFSFFKMKADIGSFADMGKVLAWVIGGVLIAAVIALTSSMVSLAISVIAATWPVLAIIAAIVGVILIIKNWGAIVDWFSEKFSQAWDWIKEKAWDFMTWLAILPYNMIQIGSNIVDQLKEGIMAKWDDFKVWFMDRLSSLGGALNPMNWFGGGEDNVTAAGGAVTTDAVATSRLAPTMIQNNAAGRAGNAGKSTYIKETSNTPENFNVTLQVGDVDIHKATVSRDQFERVRN